MLFGGHCKICSKKTVRSELCRTCTSSLRRSQQRELDVDGYYCRVASAYSMDDSLRKLILSFKYHRARRLASWMAAQMYVPALSLRAERMRAITWLPATPHKIRERGYDQGQILARALSLYLNLPLIEILSRDRSDTGQTGLTREQRSSGPQLELLRNSPESVLLVDDVVTTGASLKAGLTKLISGGASELACVVFASVDNKFEKVAS